MQSVCRSFFRRLNEGLFAPKDSRDLWQLPAAMTFHKARNAVKFHQCRRDVRRKQTAGNPAAATQDTPAPSQAGTQEVAVLLVCLEPLLHGLPDNYRDIVVAQASLALQKTSVSSSSLNCTVASDLVLPRFEGAATTSSPQALHCRPGISRNGNQQSRQTRNPNDGLATIALT